MELMLFWLDESEYCMVKILFKFRLISTLVVLQKVVYISFGRIKIINLHFSFFAYIMAFLF